jgi:hypothetical protein
MQAMTWHKGICYPGCPKHWGQKHNGKRENCSLCKPWLPYYGLRELPAFRKLREDYINHDTNTCLFEYTLSDAEQSLKGTWVPNPKYKEEG